MQHRVCWRRQDSARKTRQEWISVCIPCSSPKTLPHVPTFPHWPLVTNPKTTIHNSYQKQPPLYCSDAVLHTFGCTSSLHRQRSLRALPPQKRRRNHIDRFYKDTCIDFGHRGQDNLGTSRHANEHIFGKILGWDRLGIRNWLGDYVSCLGACEVI
jgi:hypothetical protein